MGEEEDEDEEPSDAELEGNEAHLSEEELKEEQHLVEFQEKEALSKMTEIQQRVILL
jgi:hypothetical protein